jgi:folate-binding protein YgfZ
MVELATASTYAQIRESCAWHAVARDGIRVAGPDALTWLQGQVSQDIARLAAGDASWTLVLSPQGKVDSFARVTMLGDNDYLLDVAEGDGEVLGERLRRFKIRVKAELSLMSPLVAVELRGPQIPSLAIANALVSAPIDWQSYRGVDMVFDGYSNVVEAAVSEMVGIGPGDDGAFEAARIEAGWPVLGSELTERTIPQEVGPEFVDLCVNFTKGCYTGQELVARLDSRGSNVARRLRGVVIDDAAPTPAAGDDLLVDGVSVGQLTSVCYSPGLSGYAGLAYVKRAASLPARALVGAGSVPATIRELPLS